MTPSDPVVAITLPVVESLIVNPVALNEFPFLQTLRHELDCATCDGKRRRILSKQFKEIRQRIGQMTEPGRTRLKQILNAGTIEVTYTDDRRQSRVVRF